jgi:hypothetical protein
MSAQITIETESLSEVLWVPSQALFDRDGQKFVYRWDDGKFSQVNVDLVRAGESRAVVNGLEEDDVLALSDPTKTSGAAVTSSASQALSTP